MQISSSANTFYSEIYAQKTEQTMPASAQDATQDLAQNLQGNDQYRTMSVRTEQNESRVEQGKKLLEITETKKTVEKQKIDLYA